MTDGLYVTAMESKAGKAVVALGVMELLARQVERLAVFRPVVAPVTRRDPMIELMLERYGLDQAYEQAAGMSYDQAAALTDGSDTGRLVAEVVARFSRLRADYDAVLVIGSDFIGPAPVTELELNATLAANLGLPVLNIVSAAGRRPDDVVAALASSRHQLREQGCSLVASVINQTSDATRADLELRPRVDADDAPVYILGALPVLAALTVDEVAAALGGEILSGERASTDREIDGYIIGSGLIETTLGSLREGSLLVAAGDRSDLAVAVAVAADNPSLPTPSGIVLTCGLIPGPQVRALLDGTSVPVVSVAGDTYSTLHQLDLVQGEIRPGSRRKIAAALGEFSRCVRIDELERRISITKAKVVTPLMFSSGLLARARADQRRIVLPEGTDDRVLLAAQELVHQGIVELTLLGDVEAVAGRIAALGLDLGATEVIDPSTSPLRDQFAQRLVELRAHKGMTEEMAWDQVIEPSYFGTLMVEQGLVDGMVSGAAHTTAQTIRPALEIIRTVPGISLVSSSFLMCLPDKVLVFADCAVNPEPTAEQLADIAISSAATAEAFGVEPRVAMLSYSTGSSGSGAEVDKVRAAAAIVRERAPSLPLTGPIQYDAAMVPSVAASKLPDDPVAGHATVLIFPDLNTGNTTYKAVQRAADAVAIGPVLQGLRMPVNDLSRGCLVPDIVNTVAITAIQASNLAAALVGAAQ